MLLLQFSVFCFQKCYYILVCVSFALFYLIVIQVCKFVYFLKFGKSPVIISSSCLPSPCIPVLFWITRWYTTNLLGSMCCFWKKYLLLRLDHFKYCQLCWNICLCLIVTFPISIHRLSIILHTQKGVMVHFGDLLWWPFSGFLTIWVQLDNSMECVVSQVSIP